MNLLVETEQNFKLHHKNHFFIVEIIATSIALVAIFHCNRVINTVHSLRPTATPGVIQTITKRQKT